MLRTCLASSIRTSTSTSRAEPVGLPGALRSAQQVFGRVLVDWLRRGSSIQPVRGEEWRRGSVANLGGAESIQHPRRSAVGFDFVLNPFQEPT